MTPPLLTSFLVQTLPITSQEKSSSIKIESVPLHQFNNQLIYSNLKVPLQFCPLNLSMYTLTKFSLTVTTLMISLVYLCRSSFESCEFPSHVILGNSIDLLGSGQGVVVHIPTLLPPRLTVERRFTHPTQWREFYPSHLVLPIFTNFYMSRLLLYDIFRNNYIVSQKVFPEPSNTIRRFENHPYPTCTVGDVVKIRFRITFYDW